MLEMLLTRAHRAFGMLLARRGTSVLEMLLSTRGAWGA